MIKDRIYKVFRLTYRLAVPIDKGAGTPVIFLHGLASDSNSWKNVLKNHQKGYRYINIDLLGFGKSPTPDWAQYSLKCHTKSVAKTISKLKIDEPVTVVGHSMGGLIAIELAKQNPKLVKNLILIGTPLYAPDELSRVVVDHKTTGKYMTNWLFKIYELITENPNTTLKGAKNLMKVTPDNSSFKLSKNTWVPFKKSLTKAVMEQNSLQAVSGLSIPIHFYYGLADVLVIITHFQTLSKQQSNVTSSSYVGGHMVSTVAAKKIIKKIQETNSANS